VGLFHEPKIFQSFHVAPPYKVRAFLYYSYIQADTWTFGWSYTPNTIHMNHCSSQYHSLKILFIATLSWKIPTLFTIFLLSIIQTKCWFLPVFSATSHMRLRAHDHYTSNTPIGEKAELVQVRFTPRLRDQGTMWIQDGCEIYIDSHMPSTGFCFSAHWTIFKSHLSEVGLTQNRETKALQTLTTVDLLCFIMCEDLHE
jgi:hypothetical protein